MGLRVCALDAGPGDLVTNAGISIGCVYLCALGELLGYSSVPGALQLPHTCSRAEPLLLMACHQ